MNRVVLCGTLSERPRLSTTAIGLWVATLRLQVPRQGLSDRPQAVDEIDCLAFDDLAHQLHQCGEPGLRINLEGWLLSSPSAGDGRPPAGVYWVAVEAAYWLDPRQLAPETVSEGMSPPSEAQVSVEAETATGDALPVAVHSRMSKVLSRFSTLLFGVDGRVLGNGKRDFGCN